jgi:hypothetical protein
LIGVRVEERGEKRGKTVAEHLLGVQLLLRLTDVGGTYFFLRTGGELYLY